MWKCIHLLSFSQNLKSKYISQPLPSLLSPYPMDTVENVETESLPTIWVLSLHRRKALESVDFIWILIHNSSRTTRKTVYSYNEAQCKND